MPISRCQIRNEYRLADPELYRAADKDDPEALLEGIAMAGLVGVLRQLGDLAEFAAEIFHDLHEEVMATAARGHGLMNRVQQLEAEFPSIEKEFLSQTNLLSFFTNTGIDWHPNLRTEQSLVTHGDLPRFVMDSYEECRGPPRLFLLDKFDVAGAGACLKRYTDPSFFKMEAASSGSGVARVEVHREKRIRKAKQKKGTHRRNGETTPDIAPTHAKLHQLFLEERIENAYSDPARLVKLKKRQLHGSVVEARTRKSYMEKFLESPSPDHKMVCETSIIPLPIKSMSDDASETGVRILEISTISPVRRSLGNESTCSSPTGQEIELKLSSHMDRETDHLVKVNEQMDVDVMDEISSNHRDVPEETELAVHGQKREGSIDGYHSDDATGEVDNYLDALTTVDSEMQTKNEFRPKNSSLHIQKVTDTDGKEEHQEPQSQFSDSQSFGDSLTSDENSSFKRDRNEEHADLQAQFSDSQSIGTSSSSDGNSSSKRDRNEEHVEPQAHFSDSQSVGDVSASDEYSSFNKDRASFSQADSLSTMVKNIQSGGYIAPILFSHTKHYASEIKDAASNQQTQMVGSQTTNSIDFNMHEDTDTQEEEIVGSGQASSSSCLMNSDNIFLHLDPGVTSSAGALSTEIQIDETPSDPVELHSRLSDDRDRDHVQSMAAVPDALSLMKDDACSVASSEKDSLNKLVGGDTQFNSDAFLETLNVEELAPEDQCNDQSVVTMLSAEPQNKNSEVGSPGEPICPSIEEVDLSPGATLPLDFLDLKSEDCFVENQINLEDLSPVVETTSVSSFTRLHGSDLNHETTQDERDSAGVDVLYSDPQSNVEDISRMVHPDEISGSTYSVDAVEDDGRVEHPSSPELVAEENHVLVNDILSEQVQLEDKTLSAVPSVDGAENQASFVTSSASGLISSPSSPSHDLENSIETPPDSSDFHQMEMESNKVESIKIVELELEKRGNQLEPSSEMTSNIISSSMSKVTYSQEYHSTFVDPQEEIDVNEAVAGKSLTELEVQKVVNQLEVASADVQSSPNRSLSCDPSGLEMSNSIQASFSEEKIQCSTSVNDVTMAHRFSQMDTQELDSSSLCQNDLSLNGKDATSSSSYNHLESETPLELSLPSLVGQWDAECLLTDEENSNSEKLQSELIQTSNELKHERSFDIASEAAPDIPLGQPSSLESSQPESAGKEINPTVHVMDPVTPIIPDLFPKAAEANREEMPPMPPLPPMQWRMGKVQHAFPAPQRESIEVNQVPFQPTQSIGIEGKAQFGLLGSERETLQFQNPFLPVMATEGNKLPHTSGFSVGVSGHPFAFPLQFPVLVNDASSQYDYLLVERSKIQNPFLTLPVISTGRPPHGYGVISEGEAVKYSNQSSPMPPLESAPGHYSPREKQVDPSTQLTIDTGSNQQSLSIVEPPLESSAEHDFPREKLVQPSSPLRTETSSEVKAPHQSSSNGEVDVKDPLLSSMSPRRTEAVQPRISLLPPEGEMSLSSGTSALISMFEGETPNGKPQNKLPRPQNPLIDAVAFLDKSKLRKVTERVRSQIPPKEEERDSLLEQIRTKSFNLKPTVMTRPSMQRGPRTNLKVAAILEKANAIRQALAGSDEDDDADNWSDS